ncbi:bridging integrator 2-like isoform X2 [Ornithodoros turicata]|uniref:bridging integrator 2-like isoform X2 n=1 Tax=Ornithodoros turicata TaxID=34597 RepID=UPI003139B531
MADGKGGSFTKVVQKHAGRAKERILQNLGRADKTKDEVFEVYMYNFSRQQNAALKLQKEFKNYVMCIKGLQLASKALMDTLSEIYEQEWVGHEQIPVKAQTLELLWEDYHRKINDQVMMPLNSYITQFADVRGRIAKRGRKLVDYDKCRHSVESLRNSAKKKDDYKLGKAREELEQAKQMYEIINNELHDELPALYDSRIPFLVSNLQTFFSAEGVFHGENSKVFTFLMETMQKLSTESEKSGIKFPPITLDNASPRSYGLQNQCMVPLQKRLTTVRNGKMLSTPATHQPHSIHSTKGIRRTQSDRDRRSRSLERLADDLVGQLYHEQPSAEPQKQQQPLQHSGALSRYSEQHLSYAERRGPSLELSANNSRRSFSTQHLSKRDHEELIEPSKAVPLGIRGDEKPIVPPFRRRSSASRTKGVNELLAAKHGTNENEASPERFVASHTGAQYARVRRYSEQSSEVVDRSVQDRRPVSSVGYRDRHRYSVDRFSGVDSVDADRCSLPGGLQRGLMSSSSSMVNRPVELYLVVRPAAGKTRAEAAVQVSSLDKRLYGNVADKSLPPASSLVSREVETRPYEEIEFRKGKTDRNSDISIKVTETNGQVTSPLMASPVRSEPECVACGTSSRMKCIWLNDAEFSALGYQPWQCLRCAVHGSLDEARRNLCIWFTRVTKLKANYSQWHWKRQGGAARLDNEDMPGYRGSYAEQNGGEVPVARKREEKEYEPVEVGAQMKDHTEDLYDIPVGATTTDLPSGVLYRVRATYKYTAEDVDELNFESGELIRVVEYEDPEEQEEGWLMGIKESTGEKGLFPANFTRPI